MKYLLFTLTLILGTGHVSAQINNYKDSRSLDVANPDLIYLRTGIGYWMPSGNLSEFIDGSPLFELAVFIPDTKKNRSFELGIQLAVPQQQKFFVLSNGTDPYEVEATSVVNGYVKFNKHVYERNDSRLYFGLSLGMASIFLDPLTSEGAAFLDYDSMNAVLVAPGATYDFTFKDDSMLFVSLDLQYTPFKMERAVTRDLNSFILVPKIAYRF